jgi:hypothetical protein
MNSRKLLIIGFRDKRLGRLVDLDFLVGPWDRLNLDRREALEMLGKEHILEYRQILN